MARDKHALNHSSYDSIAAKWDAARTGLNDRERPYLDILLEGCPAGGTILDLGCGTGRPMSQYVIGRGFHVMGIDQSSALVDIARTRFPSETWVQSPIENWSCEGRYCGAICWDALFHVGRDHHAPVLASIHACLAARGRLILTTGGSANDPFTDTMFEHEFFYDSLPPQRLLSLMAGIGYELLLVEYLDLPTGGRDKGRIGIVAEKPGIYLEPASLDDAPRFAAVEQDREASQFVSVNTPDEHALNMSAPNVVYLRVMRDDDVAGFVLLVLEPDEATVELRRIVIDDRGRGVGQIALGMLERYCQAVLGRSRIWLDVFEDNARGRYIYEKFGYLPIGERSLGERRLLLFEKALEQPPDVPIRIPEGRSTGIRGPGNS